MRPIVCAALMLLATPAIAEVNAGNDKPNPVKPFTETGVATFDYPWAIAFLPDGHMLITGLVSKFPCKGIQPNSSGSSGPLNLGLYSIC